MCARRHKQEETTAEGGNAPLPVAATAKPTAASGAVARGTSAVARTVATVVAAEGAGGGAGLLLLVGVGHDHLREVQVLTKVGDTLVGKEPVVVLPRVGAAHVSTGAEEGERGSAECEIEMERQTGLFRSLKGEMKRCEMRLRPLKTTQRKPGRRERKRAGLRTSRTA